ncbi:MFS transporter [Pseudochelatococcus contaminans]|uniref:Putative MFS transporter n=1 Tax=Pseudochelatococcus contaminans TaxID=1538103 RepID=A0A7W5Z582_9HYPH|nr:MFS transporter [Pseudochelatococcus contaminans]MBB3809934.1 putative MFS transporter [Pseudochelatococcus contaminans]
MENSASYGEHSPLDKKFEKFQRKVTVCASGGKLCDGWILAVIGVALPLTSTGLDISPTMEGLIGSASLIGLFIGGLVFGWVTDKLGRQKMFLATLAAFLVCSILQFFVTDPTQLFVLRVILGLAVGADYAIAGAFIAEFNSKERRGPGLAGLLVWWYIGFTVAATMSIVLISVMPDYPDLWRVILASSFLPALVMMVLRIGLPESPRWLASKGRMKEAHAIAEQYLDPVTRQDLFKEKIRSLGYSALFSPQYIKKTALTSIFWMAQITPFFAIYIFLPKILQDLHFSSESSWGEIVLYIFLLIGCLVGVSLINRLGRRKLLIYTFIGQAIPLLVLGVWFSDHPAFLVLLCFIVFAFSHAAGSTLQMLYPSEIFPTEIRATGVGFAAGMSRLGAAAGTFLLPIGLALWGTGPVMLIGGIVSLIGLVVSYAWAPETKGMELSQTVSAEVAPSRSQRQA